MVSRFTVFGSCTCRDVFYSGINKNYKDYFEIGPTGIRLSFISIMQEPVEYKDEDLDIYPKTGKNIHFTEWIKKDFDKVFLKNLKEENFEYLLMDTYYDTNFGIVEIGNGQYVTNNIRLNETAFFENLEEKRILTIYDNTEEYFEIWKKHCNIFFKYLEENCPKTKLILNPSRHVYRKLDNDGKIIESEAFKRECEKFNRYRDMFDEYIAENFDVDVLYFDEDTLSNENHFWGCSSLHFDTEYFTDITNQLNLIIERDKSAKSPEDELENKNLREEKRDNLLKIIQERKEIRRKEEAEKRNQRKLHRRVLNKLSSLKNKNKNKKEGFVEDSTKRVEIEKIDDRKILEEK
ncbi:DUF6270 domain-containing protein [uncultured Methanobrevibacter sp.]|uniref:DUF6270 domain-containing protein n=1 Tax=uncultured Methanobrevibacter sp. TaxID=253161 RepID=UPI00260A4976